MADERTKPDYVANRPGNPPERKGARARDQSKGTDPDKARRTARMQRKASRESRAAPSAKEGNAGFWRALFGDPREGARNAAASWRHGAGPLAGENKYVGMLKRALNASHAMRMGSPVLGLAGAGLAGAAGYALGGDDLDEYSSVLEDMLQDPNVSMQVKNQIYQMLEAAA